MFELVVLFLPLVAIVSFVLGYLFKGSFSSWLLKRNAKSSYLDNQNPLIKDNDKDAKEVLDRLLNSVDYLIDHNIAIEAAPLALDTEDKHSIVTKASKSSTLSELFDTSLVTSSFSRTDDNIKFSKGQNRNKTPLDYHHSFYGSKAQVETSSSLVLKRLLDDQELKALKEQLKEEHPQGFLDKKITPSLDANESAGDLGRKEKDQIIEKEEVIIVEAATLDNLDQLLAIEHVSLPEDHFSSDVTLNTPNLSSQSTISQSTISRSAKEESKKDSSNLVRESEKPATKVPRTLKVPQSDKEVENWQITRSFTDLQKPVAVLAKDVAHLLEVQLLAGLANMQRGDYNRAIKIYRNILSSPSWKEEGHELAQINLARCYFSAGIYSRALDLLFPLLGENSKFEKEIIELLLRIYLLNSDWKAALAVAKGSYELTPNHKNLERLVHFYLQRLIQCYHEIGHKRTMFAFQKIIELNRSSVRPYFSRGNYHFALGDYKSALDDYHRVLEKNVELLPALVPNLAYCYGGLSIIGEDLAGYLEKLKTLYPEQAWINLYLDLYLTGMNFIDRISNFEYKNIAQSSEVNRDLAYSASIEARDIGLDEESRVKLYGKKSKASLFLNNLANSLTFAKTNKVDLQQRLTILLRAYQESDDPVILERILGVMFTLLNSLPLSLVAQTFALHEGQGLKGSKNEKEAVRNDYNQPSLLTSKERETLMTLLKQLETITTQEHYPQATYGCKYCGFRSEELFWLCPSCNRWETFSLHSLSFKKRTHYFKDR